jgi:hypothetical protein
MSDAKGNPTDHLTYFINGSDIHILGGFDAEFTDGDTIAVAPSSGGAARAIHCERSPKNRSSIKFKDRNEQSSLGMFIEALVEQEATGGLDIFWILMPILCCIIFMTQSRGGGNKGGTAMETVSESWYTVEDIEKSFKTIEATVAEWRKESEEKRETSKGVLSSLRGLLGGGKPEDRFVVKETIPPRLYRMSDPTGPIYFELTEVVGGGTVVKTTFSSNLRSKMARFKASLPLKIPATPVGNRCPACGKPMLPEFNLCPYCGEKTIKE